MHIAIEQPATQHGGYPLILTLDTHGVPHRWISWQHACYYYTKDQVAWSTGARAFTVYGGLKEGLPDTTPSGSIGTCRA